MKKYFFILLSFLAVNLHAQIMDPVDWSFETKDLGDGTYELHFLASMDDGWAVYSQNIEDGGPIPTSFTFDDEDTFEIVGEIKEEGEMEEKFDKMFEMTLRKYSDKVNFVAVVKGKEGQTITGYLTFMTCDSQRCLPPEDVDFEFVLK